MRPKSLGGRCNSNSRLLNNPPKARADDECGDTLLHRLRYVDRRQHRMHGPAQVFGQIKGEVRASDLLIGDGAQIEGTVIAQDVTVCGSVKGTIRAVRVKLQNGGAVEGDIFHRSLSIEENSQFEGSASRKSNGPAVGRGQGPARGRHAGLGLGSVFAAR
jgi:cytoskeletal protein CcmA (bactofilin family)